MASDRIEAINALLVETQQAHGVYEAAELNGVYDQDWPRWYAAFAVEHGISAVGSPEATCAETLVRLTRILFFIRQPNFEPSLPTTLKHTQHTSRLRDLPARDRIEEAQQTFSASLLFRTCL